MLPIVQETVIEGFSNLAKSETDTILIFDEMKKITGEVVGKLFFARSMSDITFEGQKITLGLDKLTKEMFALAFSPVCLIGGPDLVGKGYIPSHRKILRRMKNFRDIVSDLIEERRNTLKNLEGSSKRKDLLQMLLEMQLQGDEDAFTNEEIISEFMTFFIAGMDTTAHLLSMTTYFLQANPDVKQKVLQEMREMYTPYGSDISIESLNKMEYTNNVLKEVLRMVPPAPGLFLREAVDDHMLGDIKVKKGTLINVDFITYNFNPKVYENPDKFDPDRWVKLNEKGKLDTFAFLPFSAGQRNCIGQHLAMHEAKIILCEFLKRFDYELRADYKLVLTIKTLYQPEEELRYKLIRSW